MNEWLNIIDKFGTVGLLIINIFLLLKGEIFSKAAVNKMLDVGDKRAEIMAKKIAESMQDGIRAAVEVGVLQAVARIREMSRLTGPLRKEMDAVARDRERKGEQPD